MNSQKLIQSRIKQTILELCSEDDWGSWELWWNVAASNSAEIQSELKVIFVSVIQEMVSNGQLISKRHRADGICVPDEFDVGKFVNDLDKVDKVDINSFYWFGTV